MPDGWYWEEGALGWSLISPRGSELGIVNNGVSWAKFSWSARRSAFTLWGDSTKGAPAADLQEAQEQVADHVFRSHPAQKTTDRPHADIEKQGAKMMEATEPRFYVSTATAAPCVRDRSQNLRTIVECKTREDAAFVCSALNAADRSRDN